jgi:hypothetical protein
MSKEIDRSDLTEHQNALDRYAAMLRAIGFFILNLPHSDHLPTETECFGMSLIVENIADRIELTIP